MRKILVLASMFTKDDLYGPFAPRLNKYEKYGATYDVAVDTSRARYGGQGQGFILKLETEGPEWVEPDPEIMEKIKDAEVLLLDFSAVNKKMIDAAKNLKLIGVMRSGVENVNVAAATAKGIAVCNCPGRVSEPVADYTVALILMEARSILRVCLNANQGEWKQIDPKDSVNAALRNHVVGLIGFGIIGRKVAQRLNAFGMKVIAYDPFGSKEEAAKLKVDLVSFEELLKQSDFVSMHARLSEETKNLMGEKQFSLMKPTAVFINTARAGLVDEDALVRALTNKTIRSAALDVYKTEPLPKDHPLLKLDNVTLTPHKAGAANDNKSNSLDIILESLDQYFAGEKLSARMN
jgi:D-3-phosphoglycerate dehydrogenase